MQSVGVIGSLQAWKADEFSDIDLAATLRPGTSDREFFELPELMALVAKNVASPSLATCRLNDGRSGLWVQIARDRHAALGQTRVCMGARVDWLLPRVAAELDLELIGVLGDGEFGAALVRDASGCELVLKALPDPVWAPRFERGAALSARIRSADYPVPRYHGTGVAAGAAWSLQERMPGATPDVMTEAHARQLLTLARRHQSRAGRTGDVVSRIHQELGDGPDRLVEHPDTAELGRELRAVLADAHTVAVRTGDVVHGDFHHRNFLAAGDRVTAVFDWELAWIGDWRVDLVNLACWGSWVPWQIPPAVNAITVDTACTACEPAVLALFTAFHTVRAVDFNLRHHPDRLPRLLDVIDDTTRSWLQAAP